MVSQGTAGTGLFKAIENGWEIHWSLFEFPNHFHRGKIVYELIISPVWILLYNVKYIVNFLNFKSYCFPLIYQIKKQKKKDKNTQNLLKRELKYSPRLENLETMINISKKVITWEWNICCHIFITYKIYFQMKNFPNMKMLKLHQTTTFSYLENFSFGNIFYMLRKCDNKCFILRL